MGKNEFGGGAALAGSLLQQTYAFNTVAFYLRAIEDFAKQQHHPCSPLGLDIAQFSGLAEVRQCEVVSVIFAGLACKRHGFCTRPRSGRHATSKIIGEIDPLGGLFGGCRQGGKVRERKKCSDKDCYFLCQFHISYLHDSINKKYLLRARR